MIATSIAKKTAFFIFLCASHFFSCYAKDSSRKIQTLYSAMDPFSIPQHLAMYTLYPDAEEGKKSLKHAYFLISGEKNVSIPKLDSVFLKNKIPSNFANLLMIFHQKEGTYLNEEELSIIEDCGKNLGNRKLKGYGITNEESVFHLLPEEIDLSRALLLSVLGNDSTAMQRIRQYEALLDIISLQILSYTSRTNDARSKIQSINEFIFHKMRFRFPPESSYANAIDFYTFLPSVLESRKGVCLGVSALYLCLAQRLSLSLEAVAPPGHIYLRYREKGKEINIETTSRGVNIPSENYLGINTKELQTRNLKEVVGLIFFNQASLHWQKLQYKKAIEAYRKALLYIPNDPLILEFLAYSYLADEKEKKSKEILKSISSYKSPYLVKKSSIIEDLLNQETNSEGIQAIFLHVDEKRESIIAKKELLLSILERFPKFREGIFHLAIAWLQLNRYGEALEVLNKYHEIDSENPTVEYYLSVLSKERFNYEKAWKHYRQAKTLTEKESHHPLALKDLYRELRILSPN